MSDFQDCKYNIENIIQTYINQGWEQIVDNYTKKPGKKIKMLGNLRNSSFGKSGSCLVNKLYKTSNIDENLMRVIVAARTIIVDKTYNCALNKLGFDPNNYKYYAFGSSNLTSDYDLTIIGEQSPKLMWVMFLYFLTNYGNTLPQSFDTNLYCVGYFKNTSSANNLPQITRINNEIFILQPKTKTDYKNLVIFFLLKMVQMLGEGIFENQNILEIMNGYLISKENVIELLNCLQSILIKTKSNFKNQSGGLPKLSPLNQEFIPNPNELKSKFIPIPQSKQPLKPIGQKPLPPIPIVPQLNFSRLTPSPTPIVSNMDRQTVSYIKSKKYNDDTITIISKYFLNYKFAKNVFSRLYSNLETNYNSEYLCSIEGVDFKDTNIFSIVSSSLFYAMEAYYTTATINVVVMEMQGKLIENCEPIEYFCSVMENLTDYLTHIKDYTQATQQNSILSNQNFINKIFLKLSKYVYRIYYSLYKYTKDPVLSAKARRINDNVISKRGSSFIITPELYETLFNYNGEDLNTYSHKFFNLIINLLVSKGETS